MSPFQIFLLDLIQRVSSKLGSAATRDVGTASDQIPLNSQLSSAAKAVLTTSYQDRTKDHVLKVGDFGYGVAQDLGTLDLDTVLVPGIYRQAQIANASIGRHYPEVKAGSLQVLENNYPSSGSGAGVTQMFITFDDNNVYLRMTRDTTTPTWTAWKRLRYDGEVIPLNQGGTGSTSALAARNALGLGNAATKTVGTGAGQLMEVGAFGWGSENSNTHYTTSNQIDTHITSGVVGTSSAANPGDTGDGGVLTLAGRNDTLQMGWSGTAVYFRNNDNPLTNNPGYGAWQRIYDTGAIKSGTGNPSGGRDGDIYLKV